MISNCDTSEEAAGDRGGSSEPLPILGSAGGVERHELCPISDIRQRRSGSLKKVETSPSLETGTVNFFGPGRSGSEQG
jgi:hypothetical protein